MYNKFNQCFSFFCCAAYSGFGVRHDRNMQISAQPAANHSINGALIRPLPVWCRQSDNTTQVCDYTGIMGNTDSIVDIIAHEPLHKYFVF
jgi:hypothetical protein